MNSQVLAATTAANRRALLSTPRAAVAVVFSVLGLSLGLWSGASASILQRAGVTAPIFGAAMTLFALIYILAMSSGGLFSRYFTLRQLLLAITPLLGAAAAGLLLAPSALFIFVGLAVFGFFAGLLDVTMNAEGTRVEHDLGRTVLAGFHACASCGLACGAILGSLIAVEIGDWASSLLTLAASGFATLVVYGATPDRGLDHAAATPARGAALFTRTPPGDRSCGRRLDRRRGGGDDLVSDIASTRGAEACGDRRAGRWILRRLSGLFAHLRRSSAPHIRRPPTDHRIPVRGGGRLHHRGGRPRLCGERRRLRGRRLWRRRRRAVQLRAGGSPLAVFPFRRALDRRALHFDPTRPRPIGDGRDRQRHLDRGGLRPFCSSPGGGGRRNVSLHRTRRRLAGSVNPSSSQRLNPMRSHTQVAVIGGGVVGASVLYHLTKGGWKDVMLIERSELTSGSTWHAAGGMHTLNGDPNVAKLQQYTIELYQEIERISGQSCGVHITGGLMLAGTRERLDWLKMAKARGRYLGIDLEMISVDEAARLFPLLEKKHFTGAMYDPIEGHVDPYGVTHAYAKSAQA